MYICPGNRTVLTKGVGCCVGNAYAQSTGQEVGCHARLHGLQYCVTATFAPARELCLYVAKKGKWQVLPPVFGYD